VEDVLTSADSRFLPRVEEMLTSVDSRFC
jgi:hypothetical protein